MGKRTFVFDLEWAEVLKEYRPEVRHEVYDAIIEYAATGTLSGELKPLAAMAFSFIKRQMDYNLEQYEKTKEERRKAGRSGGLARAAKLNGQDQDSEANASDTEQSQANVANASFVKQSQANVANQADIDIVYDNDIDKLLTLSLGVGGEQEFLVRKAYMDVFFESPKLDEFIRRWETTPEELRDMCETVLDEWTIFNEKHPTAERARKHFVQAVRLRYQDRIENRKEPQRKTRKTSGKVHTGTASTAQQGAPSPAESDIERLDRQKAERDEAFDRRQKNAVKPADYIRSLGYDPDRVTMLQVMDADWRAKNPPTLKPSNPQTDNQQPNNPTQ